MVMLVKEAQDKQDLKNTITENGTYLHPQDKQQLHRKIGTYRLESELHLKQVKAENVVKGAN